jgi:hypothetical protein
MSDSLRDRPAPGPMNGSAIQALMVYYGTAVVLINGVAYEIIRMGNRGAYGDYWVHLVDRVGRHRTEVIRAGEEWYVTRKDLVGWRNSPFQDI